MSRLNSILNAFFDFLLTPTGSLNPFWPLFAVSAVTGLTLLVVFRYTSNQAGIRGVKNQIKGHLLEIRIFKDNLRILLSAQKRILAYNFKYLFYGVRPLLVVLVPIAVMLIHLDEWFGSRPLRPGETALVSVQLSDAEKQDISEVKLSTDPGLFVEAPPLRIPSTMEVNWKIRALKPGPQELTVTTSRGALSKQVVVADRLLTRVSASRVAAGFWESLLHPGEPPIAEGALVQKIEVDYPSRSIDVLGWKLHWMLVFFVLSTLLGFAFKGLLKVEI